MFSTSKINNNTRGDFYFNKNTLLIQADATNGGNNSLVYDKSGNNKALIAQGSTVQGTFSPYSATGGWSLSFPLTGTNYVSYADSANLRLNDGDFTIEGFIYTDSNFAATQTIACKGNVTGNTGWEIRLTTGSYLAGPGLDFVIGTTVYSFSGAGFSSATNQWMHFAVCRNSGYIQISLNGYTSPFDFGSYNVTNLNQTDPLIIGVGRTPATNPFRGFISNFRVTVGQAIYPSQFGVTDYYPVPSIPLTAGRGSFESSEYIDPYNVRLLAARSGSISDDSLYKTTTTVTGLVTSVPFIPSPETYYGYGPPYNESYNTKEHGGSFYFNGTTDYISGNTGLTDLQIATGTAFTIEAWVYPLVSAGIQGIVGYHNLVAGSGGWVLYLNNSVGGSVVTLGLYNAAVVSSSVTTTNLVKIGEWSHVAVSYNGTTATIYINGVANGSSALSNVTYGTASPVIGRWNYTVAFRYYTGYITDVHVVNGTAKYPSNFTPPTAPITPIANTKLLVNSTEGNIIDSTGKNVINTVGTPYITTSTKKYGTGSITLNGTTDNIQVPASPMHALGDDPFTVEGWFYFNSQAINTVLWEIGTINTSGNPACFLTPGTGTYVRFGTGAGTQDWITSAVPSTGQWVHIAVERTYNAYNAAYELAIYFNGVKQIWRATGPTPGLNLTGNLPKIGFSSAASINRFNGYIDDFRITRGLARYTAFLGDPFYYFTPTKLLNYQGTY